MWSPHEEFFLYLLEAPRKELGGKLWEVAVAQLKINLLAHTCLAGMKKTTREFKKKLFTSHTKI
jgi:hypothetical protein